MSRGCGKLQKVLLSFINDASNPITYAEITSTMLQDSGVNDPTARLRPDRERAIRRALKGLCDRQLLFTLGTGRPGNPYRYTMALICSLCGEGDHGLPMLRAEADLPGIKHSICAKCVKSIMKAYTTALLPEILKRQSESKATAAATKLVKAA
jgi:hypothetical protein